MTPAPTTWLAAVLLTACAAPAFAGGVAMSWGDYCGQSDGGPWLLTWTCRSDTFTSVRMTCSFKPEQSHPDLVGLTAHLEGMTESATVSDWWRFDAGGCRAGALTLSVDGSSMVGGAEACIDPWAGLATGALGDWEFYGYHIWTTATCTLAQPVAIEAGLKYFACQFRVDARKTVSGECWGCMVPTLFGLRSIELYFAGGAEPEVLDRPFPEDARCLNYQATTIYPEYWVCGVGPIVPARNSTWGQIKGLYR